MDALGGQMALCADETFLQIKMLNTAKGPAVHSLRAQQDKKRYQAVMKKTLENTDHLRLILAEAVRILEKGGRAAGILTATGGAYTARAGDSCDRRLFKKPCDHRGMERKGGSFRPCGRKPPFRKPSGSWL